MLRQEIIINFKGTERPVYVYGDNRQELAARVEETLNDLQRQGYEVTSQESIKS